MINKKVLFRSLILGGFSLISLGFYLGLSHYQYRIGFPLDDAWIHQTYARNIASGKWAFMPGIISGGSTSPLWTYILSIAFSLKIDPQLWTFGINYLILWAIALIAEHFTRTSITSYKSPFPWIGTLFVFEWHFAWSAGSGMETLLFTSCILVFFVFLMKEKLNFWMLGIVIGIGVWLRPEGVTLLGPALLIWWVRQKSIGKKISEFLKLLLPFGILIVFYMVFFDQLTGYPLPTTFYAKQVEYQSLTTYPILKRFGNLGLQLLIGPGIILLPGLFLYFFETNIREKWGVLSAILWILGMISIYSWKLPVTYQHGRYMIPCMVVLILFSVTGMMKYLETNRSKFSIINTSWTISLIVVLMYFWVSGAISYGKDVSFIEHQMVDTALWIKKNLPPEKIVATHDIGALGFFGDHQLVDLAGLVTPEIIPILGKEDQLSSYLDDSNVSYLVSFPSWYPKLTTGLHIIYSRPVDITGYNETMNVYRWIDH